MLASGVVLAGGEGRRMGAYKPLVPFRGRPLVAWAADALRPLCTEILVAHGPARHRDALAAALPDVSLVADPAEGPHGGLLAAARIACEEWLLVAPGDSPFLMPATYEALLRVAEHHDGAVFLVEGQLQPLCVALRRAPFLVAAQGARSVRAALDRMDVARVEAGPWAGALRDIDTPDDLGRADA